MSFIGNKIKVTGLIVSRPISIALLFIYLMQVAFIGWMIWRYNERQLVITQQNQKINDQNKKIEELEQKVKILDVIQKNQIGFTKNEVNNLTNVVYTESQRYSLDPYLIIAVIISESTFKNHQCSDMGALGLMQIKPSTAKIIAAKWGMYWPGDRALSDPDFNIRLGTAYLFELLMKFKDIGEAVTAYNIGEAATDEYVSWGLVPPGQYFERVRRIYHKLRSDVEDAGNSSDRDADFSIASR